MYKVVLVRHGESLWNKENRFTGWADVDLTDLGREEAKFAGELLKREGYTFDKAYSSVLKRAIRTLWFVLDELNLLWIPVERSYRLNERHYGGLTGLNKAETAQKHGEEQVLIWRRSYDVPPPAMDENHDYYVGKEPRYQHLPKNAIPLTECLKDTVERVVPYWDDTIVPDIKAGKKIIIAAHGNSLRALVKHLDGISDEEILKLNIPTGVPLVYELDKDLKPIKNYYLADEKELEAKMQAVANQGKAK